MRLDLELIRGPTILGFMIAMNNIYNIINELSGLLQTDVSFSHVEKKKN